MDIERLLKLIAEQQKMSDTLEDPLDALINEITEQTDSLSTEELEDVQAATLPVGIDKDRFTK